MPKVFSRVVQVTEAERSGLSVEQVAALATELVSKDAAAVSQPR
ncbi:hypothetical protein [Streptomyces sp. NPDC054865]